MSSVQLKKLKQQMDNCRQCLEAGYSIAPKAIYSGVYSARTMIIGQAPGVTEVEAGRPFNAGSGTRLFDWLKAAGFNEKKFRSEQYMTSVTKCFPGKSKNGGGDRVPSRKEQGLCRSYLDREIQIIDPRLIIPVGRLAINLFYPSKLSLAEIIGLRKEINNRFIVPFPHPSGASRWHQIAENREKIAQAIEQIAGLRAELGL
ncbi:MAG: uracil-DNA glycosylase family protein [Anaerolineales bacterium]|nr:uracil-DNA glycosylase family protein [Anaerolineales bacterium]